MIVREVMTTRLITVAPDDTLSHAANLLRQHQFHHLPVVRVAKTPRTGKTGYSAPHESLLLEGLLTSYDIDLAVELEKHHSPGEALEKPWQERRVVEVMHPAPMCVTPITGVAAASQIMVERGLNYLPVVEYASSELPVEDTQEEALPVLVGLLTRSDLLFLLSPTRDAEAAKRFFVKALHSTACSAPHVPAVEEQVAQPTAAANPATSVPRVINVEKNAAYPKAMAELKAAGQLAESGELRQVKYLNNIVAQDHRFIKRLVKPGMGFFSFATAGRTLQGYEVMHMIRKGQVRGVGKGDISGQVFFITSLFGVAA
ncbi:MAG: DDE-type integrase/transposase/recombinase [Ktedonobacteraceae bacterium]